MKARTPSGEAPGAREERAERLGHKLDRILVTPEREDTVPHETLERRTPTTAPGALTDAVAGGTVLQCTNGEEREEKETLGNQVRDTWTALFGPEVEPTEGPRKELNDDLEKLPGKQRLFTRAVHETNRRAAGTKAELPAEKADEYKKLAAAVQSGETSNAGAFFSSAADWVRRGNFPAAAANAAASLAATFNSGEEDEATPQPRWQW